VRDPRTVQAAIKARESIAELQVAVMMSGVLAAVLWVALHSLNVAWRAVLRH
jgi:hypothetical protein